MAAEPRTLHEFQPPVGLGALAKALAKAQSEFPTIERTREVLVQLKTGGSYKFKYAPLDVILAAVRTPLSSNGLAISQLLEGPDLRTVLLHESGATLEAAVPLPHNTGDTVQQLGSAITYLRRYALQAILGIASEEDDDGNAASGNKATATNRRRDVDQETGEVGDRMAPVSVGRWEGGGKLSIGTSAQADGRLRETPTGAYIGFKLKVADGPDVAQVIAHDRLAVAFSELAEGNLAKLLDQHVQVVGELFMVPWDRDGKAMPKFRRLILERVVSGVGAWAVPADALPPDGPVAGAPIDTFPEWTGAVPIGDNDLTAPKPAVVGSGAEEACGAVDGSVMDLGTCQLIEGHKSAHKSADGSWPL